MKIIITRFIKTLFVLVILTGCSEQNVKAEKELKSDLTLNINNQKDLQINPIDIDKIYNFQVENYKVNLIVMGSSGATDFGAYCKTYLVFDNGYEMPRRYALFYIGSFGSLKKVTQIKSNVLKLEGVLFSENEHTEQICKSCNIEALVDFSAVIQNEKNKDKQQDNSEGDINSEIQVSLIKK